MVAGLGECTECGRLPIHHGTGACSACSASSAARPGGRRSAVVPERRQTMHTRHKTHRRTLVTLAVIAAALAGCSDANSGDTASTGRAGDATSASAPTTSAGATSATTLPSGARRSAKLLRRPHARAVRAPACWPRQEAVRGGRHSRRICHLGAVHLREQAGGARGPACDRAVGRHRRLPEPVRGVERGAHHSVGAIVDALVRQRLTSATRLREVDLAGYRGKYVEVTTPTDRDYARCDDAELNLWEGRPEGGYWTREPGMVERLWILDVDGQPMVIQMAVPPSATDPQIHALTHIVEAATFETPDA